ncbi:MAG: tRNA (cytidine(34)-2'-O)-methyltransferase [Spirochaetes bacterium]|nr:tRNA (cytidine(34)-2'-O)-methyltransferase [Spirochaetota bacterium]
MHLALYEPQIPQNTGNIARLVIGLNVDLILIGKLGFSLNDRYLKRAGLDYWNKLKLSVYNDYNHFINNYSKNRIIFATTKGINPYFNFKFFKDDIILFGSETKGLPLKLLKENIENTITIPMFSDVRSLNLSNSAAIIAYHALIQLGYFNDFKYNENYLEFKKKL